MDDDQRAMEALDREDKERGLSQLDALEARAADPPPARRRWFRRVLDALIERLDEPIGGGP